MSETAQSKPFDFDAFLNSGDMTSDWSRAVLLNNPINGPFQLMPSPYVNITEKLVELMEASGVVRIDAEFHGGNDEGWVGPIIATMEGAETREIETGYCYMTGLPKEDRTDDNRFVMVTAYTAPTSEQHQRDMEMARLMCHPVDKKYGSFAGDFSCNGSVWFTPGMEGIQMVDNYYGGHYDGYGDDDE